MICSLVCWRLISISLVYFTLHRKDDSGGLAVADWDGIKDPPLFEISQVIFTTHMHTLH